MDWRDASRTHRPRSEATKEVFRWSMSRLTQSQAIPPAEVAGGRALSSAELVDEVRLLAGRQGHRHPVLAARRSAIGLVALVLSWLMRLQLGFPGTFSFIDAEAYLPVHHHARHDHGDLPAHRAVPRRLRQLPDPADGRRPGHGVPLCEHAELLDLPARRAGAGRRASSRPAGRPAPAGRSTRRRRSSPARPAARTGASS